MLPSSLLRGVQAMDVARPEMGAPQQIHRDGPDPLHTELERFKNCARAKNALGGAGHSQV
jgi:hypothetical protein